jgi:hypothetical protein
MNKQTNKKHNKQTGKQTKIPGSGTIEFESYFKFWCYSSSIQSWCWYLSKNSVVVCPGGWVVFVFSFFCLLEAAAWSALPSVECSSLSLYVVFRFQNQLCRSPAVLLCNWGFTVLITRGLLIYLAPFLSGKVSDPSAGPCCQCVVMVC